MSSLRFDPFRELDRWASEVMGAARAPRLMPMDAYRSPSRPSRDASRSAAPAPRTTR